MTPNKPRDGLEWVGPYQILGVLGEGGMGTVYRARQVRPVTREVALKILKLGMDTEQVVDRFRGEQQALAVMSHPSVAKVYAAGATDLGRPYFVMELVEGVPIDEFCDAQRLTTAERVRLFVRVCRAVQHAHQKGVVHRDLKPSNILVTTTDGEPHPKIIDFGIARAVEAPDDGTRLTQLGQTVGTPAYMAPEQIEGDDVDTRVDIYSLGVVLYELLTGLLPFEKRGTGGWALFAQALVEDAPRPSIRVAKLDETQQTLVTARRTDSRGLSRELKGDLDWIVLKALEKDRERRFETANGLALDLERYLSDQPVLARPPSGSYRASKFVRRHAYGVAFSGLAVAALALFGVIQTAQAERIRQARDVADARRDQAEGLIDYMLSDLRERLEPLGQLEILEGVGQQAMAYFATLPVDEFTDDELASRSQALYQIGQVRLEQGNLPSADTALRESLRLARALSDRTPDDAERLFGLSQAEFWAGDLSRRRGDLQGALSHFEAYRDLSLDLAARDPDRLEWRMEVGYSHTNVGAILLDRGDGPGAAREFAGALAIKQALVATDPDNARWRFEESRSHNALGIALMQSGRLDDALREFQTDVEIKESLLEASPGHATYTNRLAASLGFLAQLLEVTGQPEAAQRQLERELVIERGLVASDPTNARWRRNYVNSQMSLGRLAHRFGNRQLAGRLLGDAIAGFREVLAATPGQAAWAANLADAYRHRAALARDDGDLEAARTYADSAVAILHPLAREGPDDLGVKTALAEALVVSGTVEHSLGAPERARVEWEQAVSALEGVPSDSRDWRVLAPRAKALLLLGQTLEAEAHLEILGEAGYRQPWLAAARDGRG